jgi:TonB family protein
LALTATLLSDADFVAEPVERLDLPELPTRAERRFHVVALIAAAVLHILIPVSFFLYYWLWPRMIPTAVQEIPVEVVVEQPPTPPPPPEPKEDKPKPRPQPPDFADDAPAAPTEEKVNRESPDRKTEAKATPDAPPPPTPGASPKADAPAPAPHPAEEQKGEAAPAHDLKPEPEGELPADQSPKPEDNPTQAAAPAAPPALPQKAPVGKPLPTIEDLPQYKFARAVEQSPVAGGNAETTYITIIFGRIKQHLHEGPGLRLDLANRHGIVDFYLDEGGNLVGRKLVASSGSSDLDMAVMNAIAAAAPYPAPPNWSPVSFNYNFGRASTAGGH